MPHSPLALRPGHGRALTALSAAAVLMLSGCSSLDNLLSADELDYRSATRERPSLEVPPDLAQLARDSRYSLPSGAPISASSLRAGAGVARAAENPSVALAAAGEVQWQREGQTRWLATKLPPEVVLNRVRAFWQESGFNLTTDRPEIGLIETDWAENRAKLPQDVIRRSLGRLFESLYSTGELDRFRTRVERTAAGGSEIYLTHRRMTEVIVNRNDERTVWQPAPADAELEAEMLSRLMLKVGGAEAGKQTAATPAALPAAPRPAATAALPERAVLDLTEGFDRAWRAVGLALDRSGFTVEDRDRSAGLYFIRYAESKGEEGNFFSRLFGRDTSGQPQRYRVRLKPAGTGTQLEMLNANGEPDHSEVARRIVARLADDMR